MPVFRGNRSAHCGALVKLATSGGLMTVQQAYFPYLPNDQRTGMTNSVALGCAVSRCACVTVHSLLAEQPDKVLLNG